MNVFDMMNPEALITPAQTILPVTPSDSVDLPGGVCRALWVGAAGSATIIDARGNTCANFPLIAGLNPIGVKKVFLSNITASSIWALY